MRVLIIAHSPENFNKCHYYLTEFEEESLKKIYKPENQENILKLIEEKIKNKTPITQSHSYNDYVNKTSESEKECSYDQELEIDLGNKEIL